MTITQLDAAIATNYKELTMREAAESHLVGLPKRHNATAISALYDTLNHLHIERIEALEAVR